MSLTFLRSVGFKPYATEKQTPDSINLNNHLGSGELFVSFKNLRGARTYVIEVTYTVMDESSWVLGTYASGSRGNVLPRLKAGSQIWVRVAGVGAKGRGAWSDVASRFVP